MTGDARRPVIGVSCAFETAGWTVWSAVDTNISQRTYTDRVDEAGGMPILLPASHAGTANAAAVVDLLDGLLLSGGADLDPASYGAQRHPMTTNFRRARDDFEIAICREALDRGLPVLGVCRGAQLLNVALGGDLIQHLEDDASHLDTPGEFSDHEIRIEAGSLAAEAAGAERLSVRSHHHQGIGALGEGLLATAWAEPGHAVESIELSRAEGGWALGILWHTEEIRPSSVIVALCEAAVAAEARVAR